MVYNYNHIYVFFGDKFINRWHVSGNLQNSVLLDTFLINCCHKWNNKLYLGFKYNT